MRPAERGEEEARNPTQRADEAARAAGEEEPAPGRALLTAPTAMTNFAV